MQEKVIDWLLEEKDPSVRYFTLTNLLGKSQEDPVVLTAKQAIMQQGPVPQILSRQNADGSWEIPEKFYTLKYTGTAWNLLLLAELGADPADPRVQDACEFILQHSQNPVSGGFSYHESLQTGGGLASGVIPCLTGNMVFSLVRLGFLPDSRLQKAIDWINTWQRADDGIDPKLTDPIYLRYEMCWGRHSCHMGVAKALKGLVAIPARQRSRATNEKISEVSEYFLTHHLYKKSHNLAEVSRPGWLKLGFPLMYQTDILELLGLFADLGLDDTRLHDAMDIVRGKQSADGRWKLENTFNGKMLVRIEQKGQPSKWLTLKALTALKPFGAK
jgi:hypothetical protein